MNVLLISPLPPPAGGIANWTKKYLESSKAKENQVFIVNTAVTGKRVKEFNNRYYGNELKRTYDILSDLKKQFNRNKIDVVHLNCPCGKFGLMRDYLCTIMVKKKKVKLITHFHCDVSYKVAGKTELFFFKKIVKKTDVVLTLNKRSESFINKNCSKKSIVIPNFIDNEYFNSMSITEDRNDKIQSVLFVGHIEEAKGCAAIFETARRLPEIQFTLLGYLSDECKEMEKPGNISLPGEVSNEQVKAKMLKSDLFLFPSHTEGFPYAVIEAMACGMPVIATPVGAIPDMIENNGGILVPVDDVTAITAAISALQEKEAREKMGCWNRQKVRRCYTTDKVMNRLFEVYHGEFM